MLNNKLQPSKIAILFLLGMVATLQAASTDLTIRENGVAGAKPNVIYTKTSESNFVITLNSPSVGSSLQDVVCALKRGTATVRGNATSTGGGNYSYNITPNLIATSGNYSLECSGKDGRDSVSGPEIRFYVAPAGYRMKLEIKAGSNITTLNSGLMPSAGNRAQISWSGTAPNLKIGEDFELILSGSARTARDSLDRGVSSSMTNELYENILNGTCPVSSPSIKSQRVSFSGGEIDKKVAGEIDFKDSFDGKITVRYRDAEIGNIIEGERRSGKCSGSGTSNGQCPLPPSFEFIFDYLVFPNNFSFALKNDNGDDIKVLYFGQGNSPLNETLDNLTVTALDDKQNSLRNFIKDCAAKDVDLELRVKNEDIGINIIDPSNTSSSIVATTIKANRFTGRSEANMLNIISVTKKDGSRYQPSEVSEPIFFPTFDKLMYFTGEKANTRYPQYDPIFASSATEMVVLKGRINAVDTDNTQNYNSMPKTKVYYEFYCKTCQLSKIQKITGATSYSSSPTSGGWWIDNTFEKFNKTELRSRNIEASNNLKVSSVSGINKGIQEISYDNIPKGKYQIKIKQNELNTSFPSFLLYDQYYDSNITTWGANSFVTVYSNIGIDAERNFGVDVGNSKNTRSGSRIGGF